MTQAGINVGFMLLDGLQACDSRRGGVSDQVHLKEGEPHVEGSLRSGKKTIIDGHV